MSIERQRVLRTSEHHSHERAAGHRHFEGEVDRERYDRPTAWEQERRYWLALQWMRLGFGILEGLIAIRFLLRFLGASPESAFAAIVYGVTHPFILPFRGMFPTVSTGIGVLESEAFVALIVYALLAWVAGRVLRFFMFRDTHHS